MNCQVGSRRCATWDEIEDAPQLKRMREEKSQESVPVHNQTANIQQVQQVAQQPTPPTTDSPTVPVETPKFYISAPIQGFTVNNNGGCRYLFF